MSGGTYDYLHLREVAYLFHSEEILERLTDRLARLGYADDAASETQEILLLVRQTKIRLEVRQRRLAAVWYELDLLDSGDGGDLAQALAAYRGEQEARQLLDRDGRP